MTNSEKRYKVSIQLIDGNTQEFEATDIQIVGFKKSYNEYIENGRNKTFVMGTRKVNFSIPLSSIIYWYVEEYSEEVKLGFKS